MRINKRHHVILAALGFTALIGCGLWHWRVVSNGSERLEMLRAEVAAIAANDRAVPINVSDQSPTIDAIHLNHGPADHVQSIIDQLERLGVTDRSVTTQPPRDGVLSEIQEIPTNVTFSASLPTVFELLGHLQSQEQVIRLEHLQIKTVSGSPGAPEVLMRLVAFTRAHEEGS